MKLAIFSLRLWLALAMVHSFDPAKVDYCKLTCDQFGKTLKHTACGGCPLKKGHKEITDNLEQFRKKMVQSHNEHRNKLANGDEEATYGFPSAANMMAVSYDLELEYIARCHLRQNVDGHDKCRRPEGFRSAGQNIYWSSRKELIESAVSDWYQEIEIIGGDKKSFVSHFVSTPAGHFTQIAWATVTVIGCARVGTEGGKYAFTLVCNYAGKEGSGNTLGQPIYEVGAPCSKCPQGCNKEYPALCGEVKSTPSGDSFEGRDGADSLHKILFSNQVLLLFAATVTLTNF